MDTTRSHLTPKGVTGQPPAPGAEGIAAEIDRLVLECSAESLKTLARVFADRNGNARQETVLERLRTLADRGHSEAVYRLWLMTRHPKLTVLLSEGAWVADFPAAVKVFRALESGKTTEIKHGSPDLVRPLADAAGDADEEVRKRALDCLEGLVNPDSVDRLCEIWAQSKDPLLEQVIRTKGFVAIRPAPVRVLTALLTDRPSALSDHGPEVVAPLISAMSDPDPVLADRAKARIQGLKNQAAIDELCEIWSRTRTPDLDTAISRGRYVASRPPYVRVVSAIQAGRGDALDLEDFTLVQPLVLAASDKDPTIAAFAKALLTTVLKTSAAQDALCKVVIRDGDPLAERIAVSNHYKPLSTADKALFYFLTEQWTDYESIDFDMGLLRESYQRAGKNLRARISGRARRAGRLELVELVAGRRHRRHMGEMTSREWEVTLGIIGDRQDWPTMWNIVQRAPAVWAVKGIQLLKAAGWGPTDPRDRDGFSELVRLAERCTSEAPILAMVDQPRAQFTAHGGRVTGLIIGSYFESTLASASWDSTVRLWRMPDGDLAATFRGHAFPVNSVASTPDGSILASGSGAEERVVLWNVAEGLPLRILPGHKKGASCLTISHDGRLLAAGCYDGTCRVWRIADGALLMELAGHGNSIRCVAFSPDDRALATGGDDHQVRLWGLPEGLCTGTLRGHSLAVRSLVFLPNREVLASGGADDEVILWNIEDRTLLKRLAGHTDVVGALAVSGDGRVLASGSHDRTVRLWMMPDGLHRGTLEKHSAAVTCLATDPEGRVLVSGSHDCSVMMWNFQSGIFRRPTSRPDMEALEALNAQPRDEGERGWLDFLTAQMRLRWRYDIEVDPDHTTIQAGEFDIEVFG